jgi:hypothetical protein
VSRFFCNKKRTLWFLLDHIIINIVLFSIIIYMAAFLTTITAMNKFLLNRKIRNNSPLKKKINNDDLHFVQ